MNFIRQTPFWKSHRKRLFYGIIKYNFGFCMYTSSLSLFPGRAFIYIWSVYFLHYWHLASPFPCSRMVFSDKAHKLCISTSSAARRVNHKNIVCWGVVSVCVSVLMCLYSNKFETSIQTFNSEVCVHTAAFVISLVNGLCLWEFGGWFQLRPLRRIFFFF
jgi:hypothetical protein